MNDFYTAFGLFCLYAGAAGTAYLAGRIFRGTTRELEARSRAADSHPGPDAGTNLDGFTVSDDYRPGGTLPGANSDGNLDGAAFYLANQRNARSRAILRDNLGARPGRHAAGRDSGSTDAAALT